MNTESLKKRLENAAEIVANLPQHLQAAAFSIVVAELISADRIEPYKKNTNKASPILDNAKKDITPSLMGINRTKYPQMETLNSALDCSLYLLQIARDELNIDGLNTVQISSVLKDKFRKKISKHAVSMALMAAGKLVDRIPNGKGFLYKIMDAGEKHLEAKLRN